MQRTGQIYVGLDIGTSKVACVIGALEPDAPQPSIVGVGKTSNHGVRKGAVIDVEDTMAAISTAVEEAERLSGYAVERATIGVGGSHIKSVNSKGVIAVGGMQHAITAEDIARVEDAAAVIQLPPNREILQVFSQQFRLDGQEGIRDPLGMSGVRLEVDAHVVTAATPALKNLQRSVYQTGLTINQQIMVSLAAARAVLDKRQREAGTALVDIGAGTTSLAIFEEGEVLHSAVLPVGSAHITNDIAIGLRTDLDSAEMIKVKYGGLSNKRSAHGISVKNSNGELIQVDINHLNKIISARLEELFELVNKELDKVKRAAKLPGGAVLSGGGAKLEGIENIAREVLRLPVSIGKPSGVTGIADAVNDSTYAVAVGLMLEDIFRSNFSTHRASLAGSFSNTWDKLRHIIQRLKP